MKVILGGVRGTSCMAQQDFIRYGGETTSVLVEGGGGERIILDAGTGIRKLGQRIEKGPIPSSILLLVTHYHLDHLMGLPSFSLLYRKEAGFVVASPRRNGRAVGDVLPQVMAQPYWPVQMEELHSTVEFRTLDGDNAAEPYRFGKLEVRWCAVHHPGGCTAYRVDEPGGGGFVFATDVEWSLSSDAERKALLRLCREPSPARLLVMDGQFDRDGYPGFVGWGHSTWEDCVDVARESGVKILAVTHHSPSNDDDKLARIEKAVAAALPGSRLARDGMEISL